MQPQAYQETENGDQFLLYDSGQKQPSAYFLQNRSS